MNLIRQTVQVHTIAQWQSLDQAIQSVILKNIKLKDRLQGWLLKEIEKPRGEYFDPYYVRCLDCVDSEHPGWVLHEPRYPGIHPSQISKPCLLQIYNEMQGMVGKEKIEPRLKLIFDLGHAVHRMFQMYGAKGAWGPHYKKEVEVSEEYQEIAKLYMLEGHADADNLLIIDDIPGAPIYEVGLVHEYKTINSNQFKSLARPKPEHKEQATIYSKSLDRPIVVYLYLNKDDSNLSDFPVPFDEALWKKIEGKCQTLVYHYKQQIPPPGTTGYHCQQCKFVYQCETYKQNMKK